jgi:hypothetical protein
MLLLPLTTAVLSMGASLLFIGLYLTNRRLRRHPASLMLCRSSFDLLFCAQLVAQLTTRKSALECKASAALMQFSMLASECCFLGISADLRFALTEPFHDYKKSRRTIVAAIFVSNLAIAAALAWWQRDGTRFCDGASDGVDCLPVMLSFIAPADTRARLYPAADEHRLAVCWVHGAHHGSGAWLHAQLFFFLPVVAIYGYALYVYAHAARRLGVGGLKSSLETRRVALERSRRLLVGGNAFVLGWALPYLAMLALSLRAARSASWAFAYDVAAEVFLVVIGARGIATVVGWWASDPHWSKLVRFGWWASDPHWSKLVRFGGASRASAGAQAARGSCGSRSGGPSLALLSPTARRGGAAVGGELVRGAACGARRARGGFGGAPMAAGDSEPLELGGGASASSSLAAAAEASLAALEVPDDAAELDDDDDDDDDEDEEALQPELNGALRDEVLFYTAQGIERAVLHAETLAAAAAATAAAEAGSAGVRGDAVPARACVPCGGAFGVDWNSLTMAATVAGVAAGGAGGSCGALGGVGAAGASGACSGADLPGCTTFSWGPASRVSWSTHDAAAAASVAVSRQSSLGVRRQSSQRAFAESGLGSSAGNAGAHAHAHAAGGAQPPHRVVHVGLLPSIETGGAALTVTLTDYEPDTFRKVRATLQIEPYDYLESLRHKAKERFSEGRSGAFLYFSRDGRFIVKTCAASEARTLQAILPAYAAHVLAQPRSLLSKILGFHCIEIHGRTLHFLVMANVLHGAEPPAGAKPFGGGGGAASGHMERYDLKGSWISRHAPLTAELYGQPARCRYCDRRYVVGKDTRSCPLRFHKACAPEQQLKDSDLNYKLNLRPQLAQTLADQLRADADFLASVGLMDYSLLVGVTRRRFALNQSVAGPAAGATTTTTMTAVATTATTASGAQLAVGLGGGGIESAEPTSLAPESAAPHASGSSSFEAEFVDGPACYYLGVIDILQVGG